MYGSLRRSGAFVRCAGPECKSPGRRCSDDCIVSSRLSDAGFRRQSPVEPNAEIDAGEIPAYCGLACVPCREDCERVECLSCGGKFDFSHRGKACPACRAPLGDMPIYVLISTKGYRVVNCDAQIPPLDDATKMKYLGPQLASKKLFGVKVSTVDRSIDDLNWYDPDDAPAQAEEEEQEQEAAAAPRAPPAARRPPAAPPAAPARRARAPPAHEPAPAPARGAPRRRPAQAPPDRAPPAQRQRRAAPPAPPQAPPPPVVQPPPPPQNPFAQINAMSPDAIRVAVADVASPLGQGDLREFRSKLEATPALTDRFLVPDAEVCEVCQDFRRTHAFVPCGHKCVCRNCAADIARREDAACPMCRAPVVQAPIEIFQ